MYGSTPPRRIDDSGNRADPRSHQACPRRSAGTSRPWRRASRARAGSRPVPARSAASTAGTRDGKCRRPRRAERTACARPDGSPLPPRPPRQRRRQSASSARRHQSYGSQRRAVENNRRRSRNPIGARVRPTTGRMASHLLTNRATLSVLCLVACGNGGTWRRSTTLSPTRCGPTGSSIPIRRCPRARVSDRQHRQRFCWRKSATYTQGSTTRHSIREPIKASIICAALLLPSVLVASGASRTHGVAPMEAPPARARPASDLGACWVPILPGVHPLALLTTYFAAGYERDLVVLVDDLTGDLTHVIAETDAYAGSQVSACVSLFAQSECGDLVMLLSLTDGRHLIVRRDATTGMIKRLLAVVGWKAFRRRRVDPRHYWPVLRLPRRREALPRKIDPAQDCGRQCRACAVGTMLARIDALPAP